MVFSTPSSVSPASLRRVTILGSTGSVGTQTLDLIAREPGLYPVVALTAQKNVARLAEQARAFKAELAVVGDPLLYQDLKEALAGTPTRVAAGPEALVEAAEEPSDWVMAAIVGAAGLPPTFAAARRGVALAFANKETLVCAGPLMMDLARDKATTLLPVDSEHNAIWQVLDNERPEGVTRLILTASGGPFRSFSRKQMAAVTRAQALKHPTWTMGAKISIDSATLMNKTLEVIEAHFLFGMPSERIDVVVHPQSVIHSMVEYCDGSVLAQMGSPDMRIPISTALAWPARMSTPAARLDFGSLAALTFEKPDPVRFPALRLGREALAAGGTAPAVLNAANEVAVQAFLDERIGFLDIERVNEETLRLHARPALTSLDVLAEADTTARRLAEEQAQRLTRRA